MLGIENSTFTKFHLLFIRFMIFCTIYLLCYLFGPIQPHLNESYRNVRLWNPKMDDF